jgi:hypothetical protein
MRWAVHVESMREMRNKNKTLIGKYELDRPLGRPRCRWENNIKMDVMERGFGSVDLIHMAQDRSR